MNKKNDPTEILQANNQEPKKPWIAEQQQHINLEEDQDSNNMTLSKYQC